jgi:hypothetical protein
MITAMNYKWEDEDHKPNQNHNSMTTNNNSNRTRTTTKKMMMTTMTTTMSSKNDDFPQELVGPSVPLRRTSNKSTYTIYRRKRTMKFCTELDK